MRARAGRRVGSGARRSRTARRLVHARARRRAGHGAHVDEHRPILVADLAGVTPRRRAGAARASCARASRAGRFRRRRGRRARSAGHARHRRAEVRQRPEIRQRPEVLEAAEVGQRRGAEQLVHAARPRRRQRVGRAGGRLGRRRTGRVLLARRIRTSRRQQTRIQRHVDLAQALEDRVEVEQLLLLDHLDEVLGALPVVVVAGAIAAGAGEAIEAVPDIAEVRIAAEQLQEAAAGAAPLAGLGVHRPDPVHHGLLAVAALGVVEQRRDRPQVLLGLAQLAAAREVLGREAVIDDRRLPLLAEGLQDLQRLLFLVELDIHRGQLAALLGRALVAAELLLHALELTRHGETLGPRQVDLQLGVLRVLVERLLEKLHGPLGEVRLQAEVRGHDQVILGRLTALVDRAHGRHGPLRLLTLHRELRDLALNAQVVGLAAEVFVEGLEGARGVVDPDPGAGQRQPDVRALALELEDALAQLQHLADALLRAGLDAGEEGRDGGAAALTGEVELDQGEAHLLVVLVVREVALEQPDGLGEVLGPDIELAQEQDALALVGDRLVEPIGELDDPRHEVGVPAGGQQTPEGLVGLALVEQGLGEVEVSAGVVRRLGQAPAQALEPVLEGRAVEVLDLGLQVLVAGLERARLVEDLGRLGDVAALLVGLGQEQQQRGLFRARLDRAVEDVDRLHGIAVLEVEAPERARRPDLGGRRLVGEAEVSHCERVRALLEVDHAELGLDAGVAGLAGVAHQQLERVDRPGRLREGPGHDAAGLEVVAAVLAQLLGHSEARGEGRLLLVHHRLEGLAGARQVAVVDHLEGQLALRLEAVRRPLEDVVHDLLSFVILADALEEIAERDGVLDLTEADAGDALVGRDGALMIALAGQRTTVGADSLRVARIEHRRLAERVEGLLLLAETEQGFAEVEVCAGVLRVAGGDQPGELARLAELLVRHQQLDLSESTRDRDALQEAGLVGVGVRVGGRCRHPGRLHADRRARGAGGRGRRRHGLRRPGHGRRGRRRRARHRGGRKRARHRGSRLRRGRRRRGSGSRTSRSARLRGRATAGLLRHLAAGRALVRDRHDALHEAALHGVFLEVVKDLLGGVEVLVREGEDDLEAVRRLARLEQAEDLVLERVGDDDLLRTAAAAPTAGRGLGLRRRLGAPARERRQALGTLDHALVVRLRELVGVVLLAALLAGDPVGEVEIEVVVIVVDRRLDGGLGRDLRRRGSRRARLRLRLRRGRARRGGRRHHPERIISAAPAAGARRRLDRHDQLAGLALDLADADQSFEAVLSVAARAADDVHGVSRSG